MRGLRLTLQGGLALCLMALAACGAVRGVPSAGFVTPQVERAYIPLYIGTVVGSSRFAAATVVAPNVAVTNDHNLNLLSEDMVIARVPAQDLLFFRTERTAVPLIGMAHVGQAVIAYGQNGRTGRREATGIVREVGARVTPRCVNCPERRTITYDAEAGGGFSGGPVVDAASGAVVGITVGCEDGKADNGGRRMYAIDMDVVMAEMRRLVEGQRANTEVEVAMASGQGVQLLDQSAGRC